MRYDRAGWMFPIDGRAPQLVAKPSRAVSPSLPRAVLDRVYRRVLTFGSRNGPAAIDIARRGLAPSDIYFMELSSVDRSITMSHALVDEFGFETISRVPGFRSLCEPCGGTGKIEGERCEACSGMGYHLPMFPHNHGRDDYAIFAEDENGMLFWGMTRTLPWEKDTGQPKYRMLSTSGDAFASLSGTPKYHVAGRKYLPWRVWFTEGILKSAVAARHLHRRVIGLSGTNVDAASTRAVCDLLRFWGTSEAVIAFDADKNDVDSQGNLLHHGVLAGEKALAEALAKVVPSVKLAVWSKAHGKGIDDLVTGPRLGSYRLEDYQHDQFQA